MNLKEWKCSFCDYKFEYATLSAGYFIMYNHQLRCESKEFVHRIENQFSAYVNDKISIGGW